MTDDLDQLKAEEKSYAQEQAQNVVAQDKEPNNAWIGGVVMIGIGAIFLLSNYTDYSLANWWALFILIPALAVFASAVRAYRVAGRVTSEVTSPLIGGAFMLFVASIFLFELDWGKVWPGFIIIAGVGALLNAMISDKTE